MVESDDCHSPRTRKSGSPASFRIESVIPIGNYALQPNWMDGHTYGIWTYETLRRFCDCGSCR